MKMPNPTVAPKMTRQHYIFIADMIGPMVAWPSHLQAVADGLAATNPLFNRDKFIQRAVKAWEANHSQYLQEVEDEIAY
jgi:hypothetical protein